MFALFKKLIFNRGLWLKSKNPISLLCLTKDFGVRGYSYSPFFIPIFFLSLQNYVVSSIVSI
jgi:hypothetical protein